MTRLFLGWGEWSAGGIPPQLSALAPNWGPSLGTSVHRALAGVGGPAPSAGMEWVEGRSCLLSTPPHQGPLVPEGPPPYLMAVGSDSVCKLTFLLF